MLTPIVANRMIPASVGERADVFDGERESDRGGTKATDNRQGKEFIRMTGRVPELLCLSIIKGEQDLPRSGTTNGPRYCGGRSFGDNLMMDNNFYSVLSARF